MNLDFDVKITNGNKSARLYLPTLSKCNVAYAVLKNAFSKIDLDYDTTKKGDYKVEILGTIGNPNIKNGTIIIEDDTDINDLNFVLSKIYSMNDNNLRCFAAFIDGVGMIESFNDLSTVIDRILKEKIEFYPYMTLTDVAKELVKAGKYGNVSEKLTSYIDYDRLAQNLEESYTETFWGVINKNG